MTVVQTPVDGLTAAVLLDSGVTAISAADIHTCAVHEGVAKCWGSSRDSQLGISGSGSNKAVQVTDLTSDVTAISAGANHTCAIHDDAAKCWGLNGNGQLGVGDLPGSATATFTPQTVSFSE